MGLMSFLMSQPLRLQLHLKPLFKSAPGRITVPGWTLVGELEVTRSRLVVVPLELTNIVIGSTMHAAALLLLA